MRLFEATTTAALFFILLPLHANGFNLDTHVRVRSQQSVPVPAPPAEAEDDGSTAPYCDDRVVGLTDYMRLPVEQYVCVPMPLHAKLSRLPGGNSNDFELVVPKVRLGWLEVQPVVHAVATVKDDRVVIEGNQCTLRGSPFIGRSRLNERFDFRVRAELSWVDEKEGEVRGNQISADTTIEVNVDTPFPFRTIGKRAIEKMGDKALQISLNFVLRSFLRGLTSDYQRWAMDEDYRQSRAALAEEVGMGGSHFLEEKDDAGAFNHTGMAPGYSGV